MQKKAHKFEGQTFGRLFVVRRLENAKMPSGAVFSKWLCRCECGTETSVLGIDLKAGKTKSCGCLFRETTQQKGLANRVHGGYSENSDTDYLILYRVLYSIKDRTKKKGYESDLELSDLPPIGDICPVFKIRYDKTRKNKYRSDFVPSIDRKDSSLPYMKKYKDNLYFISWKANRLKSDATVDELRKIIDYMMRGTQQSEKSSLIDSKPSQNGGNEAEPINQDRERLIEKTPPKR
jgi:hypothetical protein